MEHAHSCACTQVHATRRPMDRHRRQHRKRGSVGVGRVGTPVAAAAPPRRTPGAWVSPVPVAPLPRDPLNPRGAARTPQTMSMSPTALTGAHQSHLQGNPGPAGCEPAMNDTATDPIRVIHGIDFSSRAVPIDDDSATVWMRHVGSDSVFASSDMACRWTVGACRDTALASGRSPGSIAVNSARNEFRVDPPGVFASIPEGGFRVDSGGFWDRFLGGFASFFRVFASIPGVPGGVFHRFRDFASNGLVGNYVAWAGSPEIRFRVDSRRGWSGGVRRGFWWCHGGLCGRLVPGSRRGSSRGGGAVRGPPLGGGVVGGAGPIGGRVRWRLRFG